MGEMAVSGLNSTAAPWTLPLPSLSRGAALAPDAVPGASSSRSVSFTELAAKCGEAGFLTWDFHGLQRWGMRAIGSYVASLFVYGS